MRKPLIERFWEKVVITDGCWEWIGAKTRRVSGYGAIRDERGGRVLAHRFSYSYHIGEIPKGFLVLHRCDNPLCVNPSHLFIGTQRDNMEDMRKKERYPDSWYREKPPPPRS